MKAYFVVQLTRKTWLSIIGRLTQLGLYGIVIVLVEKDVFVKR